LAAGPVFSQQGPEPVLPAELPAELPAGLSAALPAEMPGFGGGFGVNCAIRPLQVVNVAAPVNGIIARVHVKPGQRVRAGDPLVTFDTEIARTDLAMAKARAADASAVEIAGRRSEGLGLRVDRLRVARESRAIPEADYEAAVMERDIALGELAKAEAERRFAQIEAERSRQIVEKSVVRSPVDGTVGEGLIDPGEAPGGDQSIATITVSDPLRVEAYVPTAMVAEFIARPAFHAEIAGGREDLTLDYVSAVADLSSATLSVFFLLHAPDVLPGLDCRIAPLSPAPNGD
jgi:multidrug efflux pump subunit AcrA (membrane-fusion protein)